MCLCELSIGSSELVWPGCVTCCWGLLCCIAEQMHARSFSLAFHRSSQLCKVADLTSEPYEHECVRIHFASNDFARTLLV